MERGLVTGLALNGAGIVHDFELAVAGQTSEDVDAGLGAGAFGMARETGEEVNRAIVAPVTATASAWAPSLGRYLEERQPPHLGMSLLAAAWRLGLPATVHVAVGTDIVHMHPACDPAALGRATHLDFRIFAGQVARLGGGGVYLNVGSAVLLPEVFLKAVTLARNLGHDLSDFATANLDFIQSYRPNTNVVQRPDAGRRARLQPDRPPRAAGAAAGRGARRGRPDLEVRPLSASGRGGPGRGRRGTTG